MATNALLDSLRRERVRESHLESTLSKELPSGRLDDGVEESLSLSFKGAQAALWQLAGPAFPSWFREHDLYQGIQGELLRRLESGAEARKHLERAAELAPSRAERAFFSARAKDVG